jgi:hypothetical protein
MFGEIQKIRALATKYSKQELASLVQTQQIPLQDAALAGMMIDRIAKSAMQPPQTTVAQDVLSPQPEQMPPQMAQGQPPQMPPGMPPPQMAADGGLMGMMPHSDGVAALHSGLHDMAGGGIVAFADGGDVPGYAGDKGSFVDPEFRTKDPQKIKQAQLNLSKTDNTINQVKQAIDLTVQMNVWASGEAQIVEIAKSNELPKIKIKPKPRDIKSL